MNRFSRSTHIGVAETFIVLGLIYLCFMMVGAAIVRVPAPGWAPAGYAAPAQSKALVTTRNVFVYDALKTPQFWLIWWILCLNVTAGIGVLGQASAMSQEMFRGQITAVAASGLVGLYSLFNMAGRFIWSSTSDYVGRKNTYFVFFALGTVLYALVPYAGAIGSISLFVFCTSVFICVPPQPKTRSRQRQCSGNKKMEETQQSNGAGNRIKLALAWGFVGVPLVWGVVQTLLNALKAFQ
jgi:hypothetical protein